MGDVGQVFTDIVDNPLDAFVDYTLQAGTGGLVGYEDGKVGAGITGEVAISGLKEITGAAATEEATAEARKQFEATKAKADADRKEAQGQSAREQLRLSRQAGGARGGTSAAPKSAGSRFSSLGSDESDFLGL